MVLSFLRHISIRIWIALLLGGAVSLSVLPLLPLGLGLEYNFLAAAGILLFFFLATGWVLNRWALNSANYRMAEAAVFERDGMYRDAENSFQKAVAIFDSFMISPLLKRKKAGDLGARLARFYLARSRRDHIAEDFLVAYLKSNPRDGEVAEHWLHQVDSRGGLKEEHQELAAHIGAAQPNHPFIQRTLARFYLLLERSDFPALQAYRRVCNGGEAPPGGFVDDGFHGESHDPHENRQTRFSLDQRFTVPGVVKTVARVVRFGNDGAEGGTEQGRVHFVGDLFESAFQNRQCYRVQLRVHLILS